MIKPIIGITLDNPGDDETKYEIGSGYSSVLARCGAVPILLPHEPHLAADYVAMCDGIILSGGIDPRTEAFGEPTHPQARPMSRQRQNFELAILEQLDLAYSRKIDKPALGICLGMQLMALHHGGKLNQYMPDNCPTVDQHRNKTFHPIVIREKDCALADLNKNHEPASQVLSHHQQAVADSGRLRIIATAPDGVIEAIDNPTRRFYLGVQWHPERGDTSPMNQGLLEYFAQMCSKS